MATIQQLSVEFRGGPFDGHLQVVGLNSDDLNPVVLLPVNVDLIERLTDRLNVARSEPTSIAVYELMRRGSRPEYEFLGSLHPEQAGISFWRE